MTGSYVLERKIISGKLAWDLADRTLRYSSTEGQNTVVVNLTAGLDVTATDISRSGIMCLHSFLKKKMGLILI